MHQTVPCPDHMIGFIVSKSKGSEFQMELSKVTNYPILKRFVVILQAPLDKAVGSGLFIVFRRSVSFDFGIL